MRFAGRLVLFTLARAAVALVHAGHRYVALTSCTARTEHNRTLPQAAPCPVSAGARDARPGWRLSVVSLCDPPPTDFARGRSHPPLMVCTHTSAFPRALWLSLCVIYPCCFYYSLITMVDGCLWNVVSASDGPDAAPYDLACWRDAR